MPRNKTRGTSVVCRQVCAHTGNQLAAVVTTVDTGDAGRVGCGLVWSVDPATGEVIGQITVAAGDGAGVKTPAAGAAGSGAAHSANRCGDGVTGDGGYLEAQCGRGPAGSGSQVVGVAGTAARAGHPEGAVASGWSQARVDARFYALVADVAGAPQEIIDPATGQVEGRVTQSLYGKRTWCGGVSSPLLFAGQYEDAESGWVYNRFRYYQPVLGSYNAQDPLGLAPRVASGQGYVDHAAHWVDVLGLASHVKNKQLQRQIDALTPQQKVFWVSPSRRIDSQVNSIGMIREPPIGVSAVKPVSLTLRLGTIQLWRRSSSKSKGSPRS